MELIKSVDVLSGNGVNVDIPPGDYAGFLLRFAGTNQASQTCGIDCGRFRLSLNSQDKANMDFDLLNYINDLEGGFPESNSAAGAAFAHSAFIPAAYDGLPNLIHVTGKDRLVLSMIYNATEINATKIASGTFQVSGLKAKGIQNYWRTMMHEIPSVPAGSDFEEFDSVKNLVSMYYTHTNLTRLLLQVDNIVIANDTVAVLAAISNMMNNKEATYSSLYRIDVTQGQSIGEALSDNVKVMFTASAADTPDFVLCGIDFDLERLRLSRTQWLQQYESVLRSKQGRGEMLPAEITNQSIVSQIEPQPANPLKPLT